MHCPHVCHARTHRTCLLNCAAGHLGPLPVAMMDDMPVSDSGEELPMSDDGGDSIGKVKKKDSIGNDKKKPAATRPNRRKCTRHAGVSRQEFIARTTYQILWPLVRASTYCPTMDGFWEIFSPPRIAACLRNLGVNAPPPIDLSTGWDLGRASPNWSLLLEELQPNPPLCIRVCPPCTYFAVRQFSNWCNMEVAVREARASEGFWFSASPRRS